MPARHCLCANIWDIDAGGTVTVSWCAEDPKAGSAGADDARQSGWETYVTLSPGEPKDGGKWVGVSGESDDDMVMVSGDEQNSTVSFFPFPFFPFVTYSLSPSIPIPSLGRRSVLMVFLEWQG